MGCNEPPIVDARDLADGRPCWRCRRPVLTIVVEAGTGRAHETCERGHRQ